MPQGSWNWPSAWPGPPHWSERRAGRHTAERGWPERRHFLVHAEHHPARAGVAGRLAIQQELEQAQAVVRIGQGLADEIEAQPRNLKAMRPEREAGCVG